MYRAQIYLTILHSHVSRVNTNIVKRDTYHKNRVIKQQCKLKHTLLHSANTSERLHNPGQKMATKNFSFVTVYSYRREGSLKL